MARGVVRGVVRGVARGVARGVVRGAWCERGVDRAGTIARGVWRGVARDGDDGDDGEEEEADAVLAPRPRGEARVDLARLPEVGRDEDERDEAGRAPDDTRRGEEDAAPGPSLAPRSISATSFNVLSPNTMGRSAGGVSTNVRGVVPPPPPPPPPPLRLGDGVTRDDPARRTGERGVVRRRTGEWGLGWVGGAMPVAAAAAAAVVVAATAPLLLLLAAAREGDAWCCWCVSGGTMGDREGRTGEAPG